MLLLQILRNLLILNIAHQNPVSLALCVSSTMQDQSLSQLVPEAAAAAASSDSRRNGFPWAASHLFNMYRIREWGSPFGIPLTVDCFRIMQAPSTRPPPPPLPSSIFKALPLLPLPQVPEPVPAPVMSNKRINLFFGGSQCWTFSWEMLVISGGRRQGLGLVLLLVVLSLARSPPSAVCSFIVNLLTAVALWKVDCKFHFNSISGLDYNPPWMGERVDWGPGVKRIKAV